MKKLIAILSSFGLTASMSTIVVACGNTNTIQRVSKLKLLEDKVLASLVNDKDINLSLGKNLSEIGDGNLSEIVLKMIQDKVSKLSNEYFQDTNNDRLQLTELKNYYWNQMDEIASDIARNKFYLEYTNNILTKPATSLDQEISIKNLSNLNPQDLLGNDSEIDGHNKYTIFMQTNDNEGKPTDTWNRWQFAGENLGDWIDHLPLIKELQNNKFVIVKKTQNTNQNQLTLTTADLTNESRMFSKIGDTITDDDTRDLYSLDGKEAWKMDGQTALEYRFQEYFTTKIKTENFANLLTMSYLDSNLFNISRNEEKTFSKQDAFLNISSNVAQTLQTWGKTGVGYTSKIKMVWSFTFDTQQEAREAWAKIDVNDLNPDGSLSDSSRMTLRSFYNLLGTNKSNLGTDPFFDFDGYNGIVKNDGQGGITSVDGNLKVNTAANTKIAKANGPSILSSDNLGTPFASTNQTNKFEYVFVLPIYLIDLLNDRNVGYDNGQSTSAFLKYADGQPNGFYSSYGQSLETNAQTLADSKVQFIQNEENIKQSQNFYIYANGVPYTIDEFNSKKDTNLPTDYTILTTTIPNAEELGIDGIQFTLKNTLGQTHGNIGIHPIKSDEQIKTDPTKDTSNWVKLGAGLNQPDDVEGEVYFQTVEGNLYVRAIKESLVGTVQSYAGISLSFDDASRDGAYTINGTLKDGEHQGETYSYKINMGVSASDANGYVRSPGFNYYNKNISSLDISNLTTTKKTNLLRELEFVTSKEEGVDKTAAANIYPLFLEGDQILFEPLYNSLKDYIVDQGGGSSD